MPDDDDDEDPGTITNVRYPVMPSLVALQQMRNRLHLARLGKKLMKWSALASGRELRVVSEKLIVSYEGFESEIANAFIMLARCRYFFAELNKMVIEDYQKMATLTITSTFKSSGGVKLHKYEVVEREDAEPYPYLGLGAGGQAIEDAKLAWANLLKKFISILELREAFDSLELSHKSATKKENVLGKLIIPRLISTIQYILQELEELQREELFRIKKVVQHKAKKKREKEEIAPKPSPQIELASEISEQKPTLVVVVPLEPIVEAPPPEPIVKPPPPKPIVKPPPPKPIVKQPPLKPIVEPPPLPALPPATPCVECIANSIVMEDLIRPGQQPRGTASRTKDNAANKRTASINNFLDACKDFKKKAVEYVANPPEACSELNKLIKQLDEAIALSSAVKEHDVIGENAKEFMEYCEKLKMFLMERIAVISKGNPHCCDLSILTPVSGKTTPSLTSIETQVNTKPNKCQHEVCDCDVKDDKIYLEEIHRKILDYIQGTSIGTPSIQSKPNNVRHNLPADKKKETSNRQSSHSSETIDKSFLYGTSKDTSCISNSSKGSKAISFSSTLSSKDTSECDLGAFDTKIKKVVKIKRFLNEDGTISEQVHTLIIKEEKHHPDKLSLGMDDELSYNDLQKEISIMSEEPSTSNSSPRTKDQIKNHSYENKGTNKDKDVNFCTITDQTIITSDKPIRKTKSATVISTTKHIHFLKSCISELFENSNMSISSE